MKFSQKRQLAEKGWEVEEIKHAEEVLDRSLSHDIFFSKIVFWSALLVIIFANLIVALVLIPFIIVLTKWLLYLLVLILAGAIGFLYNLLITDIGHLENKHHFLASIIVPLLAIINFLITVLVSNNLMQRVGVQNQPHNPFIIGIIFAVAFIIPYGYGRIRMHRKEQKALER